MKLKITKEFRGSTDGVNSRVYVAGETYDIPGELADVALREGWAAKAVEEKMADAPHNKMHKGAPHNKGK